MRNLTEKIDESLSVNEAKSAAPQNVISWLDTHNDNVDKLIIMNNSAAITVDSKGRISLGGKIHRNCVLKLNSTETQLPPGIQFDTCKDFHINTDATHLSFAGFPDTIETLIINGPNLQSIDAAGYRCKDIESMAIFAGPSLKKVNLNTLKVSGNVQIDSCTGLDITLCTFPENNRGIDLPRDLVEQVADIRHKAYDAAHIDWVNLGLD